MSLIMLFKIFLYVGPTTYIIFQMTISSKCHVRKAYMHLKTVLYTNTNIFIKTKKTYNH